MKLSVRFATAAALLLTACSKPVETCGEVDDLAPTGCSASELAALEREGVWHGIGTLDGGTQYVSVVGFNNATPTIDGHAVTVANFDAGTAFLAADWITQNVQVRMAFAGCTAPDPSTLRGHFQRCQNGRKVGEGAFELKRISRLPGEAEAQGLELLGEARVTQGLPLAVSVDGTHAYVAAGTGGLSAFDIADPALPQVVAQTPTSGSDDYWYDVGVHGGVLFVATSQGLRYYDISTDPLPSVSSFLGIQPSGGDFLRSLTIDAANNRLVTTSQITGEVLIFNVTNPRTPVLLGRFAGGAQYAPYYSVLDGDRLYATYGPGGVIAATLSQPSSPAQLGEAFPPTVPTRNSFGIAAATYGEAKWVFETGEGWAGHVRAIDFSAPATALGAGEYMTRPEVSTNQLTLLGTKLYVAYHQDGVRILDVSNPAAPTLAAYYNAWSDTAPGRGQFFYDGVTAVHPARDGSGLVYALETERGLLILRETP